MSVHETLLGAIFNQLKSVLDPIGVHVEIAGTPKHIDYIASVVPAVFITLERVTYDQAIPIGSRRQKGTAEVTLTVIGNIAAECAAGQPSIWAILEACSNALRGQYILPGYSGSLVKLESEDFDDALPFGLSYVQKYSVSLGGDF